MPISSASSLDKPAADDALYKAKESGRNKVSTFASKLSVLHKEVP